jgi:hypothetical protein
MQVQARGTAAITAMEPVRERTRAKEAPRETLRVGVLAAQESAECLERLDFWARLKSPFEANSRSLSSRSVVL